MQAISRPLSTLLLLAVLLACGSTAQAAQPNGNPEQSPPPQPALPAELAAQTAALRPAFAGDIAANADIPRYKLRFRIDPAARRLDGSAQITYRNRTGMPLDWIALRLYPNFPRDLFGFGGDTRMDVTSAAVNGAPIPVEYGAQRTALILRFAPALPPDEWVTLDVQFTTTLKPWTDGTYTLPWAYPMLAVRDGPHWRLDVTRFPDKVFAESAFYDVEVTAPSNLQVIGTGSTVATRPNDDGTTTHSIVTGPVREWAFGVGDYRVAHAAGGEVAVNVYAARRSSLDVQQVANVAAAALTDFERRFGPYPYRELDLHLSFWKFDGGEEHPGMIFVNSDQQIDAGTRYVVTHEVAHQWWYAVVGDDIFRQPWLDEAFAQYSAIIYDEDVAGAAVAQSDWQREVATRYRGALADGDLPVGRAITDYPSFNAYYRTVYGKGAVFLRTLRGEIGDVAFFAGLQTYYQRHRYGVTTTADVQRVFEDASGRDLAALFKTWVQP